MILPENLPSLSILLPSLYSSRHDGDTQKYLADPRPEKIRWNWLD